MEGPTPPSSSACSPFYTPPSGYFYGQQCIPDFNYRVHAFQFVTDDIGYALCGNNVGGRAEVIKTTDGGKTWIDFDLPWNQSPKSLFFKNELEGFVTVHDVTGCPPPNCLHKCVLYRTLDGGTTWRKFDYADLKGILHQIQLDASGTAYAMLTFEQNYTLMKSEDNGEKWDTLFASPDLLFKSIHFSFTLYEDAIYAGGRDGKILKISKEGELLNSIQTPEDFINDLKIIDEDNMFISGSGTLIKTTDGGLTWDEINDSSTRIIEFYDANTGIVLLSNRIGGGDVYLSYDILAATIDGGDTWETGPEYQNILIQFTNTRNRSNDRTQCFIDDKLFTLQKQ